VFILLGLRPVKRYKIVIFWLFDFWQMLGSFPVLKKAPIGRLAFPGKAAGRSFLQE
jgi:hypothetical protein